MMTRKKKNTFISCCFAVIGLCDGLTLPTQADRIGKSRQHTKAQNRCLVVTELADTKRHQAQFATMLYPSWEHINELDIPKPLCDVDLLVFCEAGACKRIPQGCSFTSGEHSGKGCFFSALGSEYESQSGYSFSTSLRFMATEQFANVVQDYDYVMRTDVDALLLPGIRSWIPNTAAVGEGFMGTDFTHKRLEKVAKRLGLTHWGVHGMQSTFYVSSSKIVPFSKMLVNLTEHFYNNEFHADMCKEVESEGGTCAWSDWHIGVSSLYATDLAANHILGTRKFTRFIKFDPTQVTRKLDHGSTYDFDTRAHSADKYAQAHLMDMKFDWGLSMEIQAEAGDFCNTGRSILECQDSLDVLHSPSVLDYVLGSMSKSLRKECNITEFHCSNKSQRATVHHSMQRRQDIAKTLFRALSG